MKVRLDHHPNYWGRKVPNHQPVLLITAPFCGYTPNVWQSCASDTLPFSQVQHGNQAASVWIISGQITEKSQKPYFEILSTRLDDS